VTRKEGADEACRLAHGPTAYAFAFQLDGWWYALVRDDAHGDPTSNIGKGTSEDAAYRDLELALCYALGKEPTP